MGKASAVHIPKMEKMVSLLHLPESTSVDKTAIIFDDLPLQYLLPNPWYPLKLMFSFSYFLAFKYGSSLILGLLFFS